MLIEVDCEDCAFSLSDPDSVRWFGQEVLMNQTEDGALYLHSNEVGDTVGRVRVLVVHDWPPSSDTPNVRAKLPAAAGQLERVVRQRLVAHKGQT
jgi:hypothetical protein